MRKRNGGVRTQGGSGSRWAFLWGVAHAFDFGSGLLPMHEELLLGGPAADAAALRGDWMRAVGRAGLHGERP